MAQGPPPQVPRCAGFTLLTLTLCSVPDIFGSRPSILHEAEVLQRSVWRNLPRDPISRAHMVTSKEGGCLQRRSGGSRRPRSVRCCGSRGARNAPQPLRSRNWRPRHPNSRSALPRTRLPSYPLPPPNLDCACWQVLQIADCHDDGRSQAALLQPLPSPRQSRSYSRARAHRLLACSRSLLHLWPRPCQ